MFGPPQPHFSQMRWNYHRPPYNQPPQWRHPGEPRVPFQGLRHRFHQPRHMREQSSENYWCETCDRGFPTEDILNKHKLLHQKCNIDGCQFIAHPKVITKHIQMQHSTGLYKKIANIKNPEDIEKWREERRKRYPTKSNIDKKAAELKERIDRGEKMGLERERNFRNKPYSEQENKSVSGQGIKRRSNMRYDNQPRSKMNKSNPTDSNHNKRKQIDKPKQQNICEEDKKLKPFAGILNLQMDSDNEIENETIEQLNDLIEDEDDCEKHKTIKTVIVPNSNNEPIVCGALTALMCDYGSSDEEGRSIIETKPVKKQIQSESIKTNSTKSNLNVKGNSKKSNQNSESDDFKSNYIGKAKCETAINKLSNNPKDIVAIQDITLVLGTEPNTDHVVIDEKSNSVLTVNKTNEPEMDIAIQENTKTIATADNIKILDNNAESLKHGKTQSNGSGYCENILKYPIKEIIPDGEDSDSAPEEIKAEIKRENNPCLVSQKSRPKDVRKTSIKGRMQANQRKRPKLPSTLLQKLLYKEMQQERNVVLQCIRYIRRNNYFDKNE